MSLTPYPTQELLEALPAAFGRRPGLSGTRCGGLGCMGELGEEEEGWIAWVYGQAAAAQKAITDYAETGETAAIARLDQAQKALINAGKQAYGAGLTAAGDLVTEVGHRAGDALREVGEGSGDGLAAFLGLRPAYLALGAGAVGLAALALFAFSPAGLAIASGAGSSTASIGAGVGSGIGSYSSAMGQGVGKAIGGLDIGRLLAVL